PGHSEDLGRHAVAVADRSGTVIADSRLDVEPAVGLDHQKAVESDRPGAVGAHRDTDAADFRSVALAALQLAFVPPEHPGTLVERLLDECARDVLPDRVRASRWAERRLSHGCVDATHLYLVDPQLARRFRND